MKKNIIIIIVVGVVVSVGLFLLYWFNKPTDETITTLLNNPKCTTPDGKEGRLITTSNSQLGSVNQTTCVPLSCINRPATEECKQFSAILSTTGRG